MAHGAAGDSVLMAHALAAMGGATLVVAAAITGLVSFIANRPERWPDSQRFLPAYRWLAAGIGLPGAAITIAMKYAVPHNLAPLLILVAMGTIVAATGCLATGISLLVRALTAMRAARRPR